MTEYNYEDYEGDVDLDPANRPPSDRVERFKGEKNRTYRVALMYFHPLAVNIHKAMAKKAKRDGATLDTKAVQETIAKALAKRAADLEKDVNDLEEWEKLDLNTAQFKMYKSHYQEGVGTVLSRLGKDGAEGDKVWKRLEDPRTYYSTIALFYPLDASGNVDVKNIARDAYVKLWRFSKGTFTTLISKNEMLGSYDNSLANSDLKLFCKAAQFQTFDIDPAGNALWLKSPSLKAKFLPLAYALYGKLVDAREISTADLKKKLAEVMETPEGEEGGGNGSPGSGNVSEDEVEDLLQNV